MLGGEKKTLTTEETMKTRTALALTGLAISFPLPTLAQEQNAVDPEVRQQIEDAGSGKAA